MTSVAIALTAIVALWQGFLQHRYGSVVSPDQDDPGRVRGPDRLVCDRCRDRHRTGGQHMKSLSKIVNGRSYTHA